MTDSTIQPAEIAELLYQDNPPGDVYESDPEPGLDQAQAAWHAGQAVKCKAHARKARELFDDAIRELVIRRDEASEPWERRARWHEAAVRQWHLAAHADDPDVGKTVRFPVGTSKLRAGPPVIEVVDEDGLRAVLSESEAPEGSDARSMEQVVFVPQKDKFMISELKKWATIPKQRKPPEAGSELTLLSPEGEKLDSVRVVAQGNHHSFSA